MVVEAVEAEVAILKPEPMVVLLVVAVVAVELL